MTQSLFVDHLSCAGDSNRFDAELAPTPSCRGADRVSITLCGFGTATGSVGPLVIYGVRVLPPVGTMVDVAIRVVLGKSGILASPRLVGASAAACGRLETLDEVEAGTLGVPIFGMDVNCTPPMERKSPTGRPTLSN